MKINTLNHMVSDIRDDFLINPIYDSIVAKRECLIEVIGLPFKGITVNRKILIVERKDKYGLVLKQYDCWEEKMCSIIIEEGIIDCIFDELINIPLTSGMGSSKFKGRIKDEELIFKLVDTSIGDVTHIYITTCDE